VRCTHILGTSAPGRQYAFHTNVIYTPPKASTVQTAEPSAVALRHLTTCIAEAHTLQHGRAVCAAHMFSASRQLHVTRTSCAHPHSAPRRMLGSTSRPHVHRIHPTPDQFITLRSANLSQTTVHTRFTQTWQTMVIFMRQEHVRHRYGKHHIFFTSHNRFTAYKGLLDECAMAPSSQRQRICDPGPLIDIYHRGN
jgi:hypothetical protein